VVIRFGNRSSRGQHLVQEGEEVVRIRSKSRFKLRDWYVSNFQLLSGLCFICSEYLVERLFLRTLLYYGVEHMGCTYLDIPSNPKGMILQLFNRQVCQYIGDVSSNVRSRRKRNLRVSIAADRDFPTCDIEDQQSILLLIERLRTND
jgi:hypothetical protein